MLRDNYPLDKKFEEICQILPKMDPVLVKIDSYLADEKLYQMMRTDLSKRNQKTTQTGRNSTPVEVILRMLIIKRVYQLSYEEVEQRVQDSLGLRQFCRVYLNAVPDDTTLIRWAQLIQPKTLVAFNERITQLAIERKITSGKKLRTDGTVIESAIHAPGDNRQLADSVRVLARTVERAKQVGEGVTAAGENFSKAARDTARKIGEVLRKRTEASLASGKKLYEELVAMTEQTIKQAAQTLEWLSDQTGKKAKRLRQTFETLIPLANQVVQQTRARIFEERAVPSSEKVVSIFEPHADIIVRGKEGHPVEYGHKVWFDEVEGGIISHYRILEGNPSDDKQWEPALQAHQETFHHPPEQASADRGLYSPANEKVAQDMQVQHVILPKRGYKSQQRQEYERQEWFVTGRKWHAGVEGRISVLKRAHGLRRCLNHGFPGFQSWVGWGVIAANLAVIARIK
jgi:transposase, IS5 family